METKAKVLMIVLVLLLAVSLFSLFYVVSSKELLRQEYESAKQRFQSDKVSLEKKANAAIADKEAAESKMQALQKDLDKISLERSELRKEYEKLRSEREDLIAELRQKTQEAPSSTAVSATPVVDDSYWAGVLKDKTGLEIQVNNLREQVNNLKVAIEEMKRDKSNMDFEVSNLNREKQDLERKLIYNERINDGLSAELVREKKDKIELNNQLKALNNEYTTIVRQLKALNNFKVDLENKLTQAQQDKLALQGRINELDAKLQSQSIEAAKEELSQEARQVTTKESSGLAKESVQLPPIIVRSAEAPASKPAAYTGKVIAINRDNNFIVIDLGEEKGIRPGLTLGIYKGGNKIATVEVVQIRRLISACDIKEESSPINVGDEVR